MRRDPAIQPNAGGRASRDIDSWERGRREQEPPREQWQNPRNIPTDNRQTSGHDRFRDNRLDNRLVFGRRHVIQWASECYSNVRNLSV
jgi:hypothetical protein